MPDSTTRFYVVSYHDWYDNRTFLRTADGAAAAYAQCRQYDTYPVYQDLAATRIGKHCGKETPACFGGYVGVPGAATETSFWGPSRAFLSDNTTPPMHDSPMNDSSRAVRHSPRSLVPIPIEC